MRAWDEGSEVALGIGLALLPLFAFAWALP